MLNEIKEIGKKLVDMVMFCHSKNIVHRDLKPSNVLISPEDNIKVIDFSFSVDLNRCRNKLIKSNCGSPNYMAPEIVLEKISDPKCCDVWALGAILVKMVTGEAPFSCKLL